MGFFTKYSDRINHVRLIVMVFEENLKLDMDYPFNDVGEYWITYVKTNHAGTDTRHLIATCSDYEQRKKYHT